MWNKKIVDNPPETNKISECKYIEKEDLIFVFFTNTPDLNSKYKNNNLLNRNED